MNFTICYGCLYTLKLLKAVKQQSRTHQIQVTDSPGSLPHSCTFQNEVREEEISEQKALLLETGENEAGFAFNETSEPLLLEV